VLLTTGGLIRVGPSISQHIPSRQFALSVSFHARLN
jgi:hypothetical protein